MGKKLTHFAGTGQDTIAVYGRKDLNARKKAAKEAGVDLPVRKVKKSDR